MTENQRKILEMLADKKISTDEAYRLLNALGGSESDSAEPPKEDKAVGGKTKFKLMLKGGLL